MSPTAAAQIAKTAADRASLRMMAERRWRVFINVTMFVAITITMVLLAMADRDSAIVRNCSERLAFTRDELEKLLAGGNMTPTHLPLRLPPELPPNATAAERAKQEEELLSAREHYFYNGHYGRAMAPGRTVGVCCCQIPHRLFLRQDGRHVIVFDGKHYELRWMPEAEFRRQAASLGFNFAKGP